MPHSQEQIDEEKPSDIILSSTLCPGDAVVMSGALRDLHRAFPGKYRTAIRNRIPEIWYNNPFVTPEKQLIKPRIIDWPWGIDGTNENRMHFMECWLRGLGDSLGIRIPMTEPNGDLYLSQSERKADVSNIVGTKRRYILLAASFKTDCRTKSWPKEHWQTLVDMIRSEFGHSFDLVQVGHSRTISESDANWLSDKGGKHYSWPLSGTIDRIGRTGIRELMLAVRSSALVIGGITFVQHLAASMRKDDNSRIPHIEIAGGRESQFITQGHGCHVLHTIGLLPCCKTGGSWKSHLDGPVPNQSPSSPQCLFPVSIGNSRYSKCMSMITPESVFHVARMILNSAKI
jgi:hypothetical protein